MKKQLYGTVMVAALSSSLSLAGDDSAKGGVEIVAPPVSECSDRHFQPLFTRYASTASDWTLKVGYRTFTDMQLQEARNFDADVWDLELTIPISDKAQFRIFYPFHTEGDAFHFEDGGALVDVEGPGGVEEWPTLYFDYQFKKSTGIGDSNQAFTIGLGKVVRPLDVDRQDNGEEFERYNHRGTGIELGYKYDVQFNNCWSLLANANLRYLWESDDLNPSGEGDAYWTLELGAALFYAPKGAWIYPGVEIILETQLHPGSYTALTVVPEVIVPLGDHVDLSAGFGIGILDDGPETDARIGLTARF